MVCIDPKHLELEDHVVVTDHITKVVKGGRRLCFIALVVVGDENGCAGSDAGKAQEVSEAIRKTTEDARKSLAEMPMVGSTIPYEIIGVLGGSRTPMKSAVEGFGVAADGPVRAVLELIGVADITSESLGLSTPIDVVHAIVEGLKQLRRAEEVATLRGKSIEEIIG